jgi:hypothetical protein
MRASERLFCLEVTAKLINRPCGAAFLGDVRGHGVDRTHPTWSLSDVMAKLLDNAYRTKAEWKRDVYNVWKTALEYQADNALLHAMADQLKEYFTSLVEHPVPVSSVSEWRGELMAITDLMNRRIGRVHRIAQVRPVLAAVADRVMRAASELQSPEDAQAIFAIIHHFHPEMRITSPHLIIDLNSLSPLAVWTIERFLRRRFKDLGKRFPGEESRPTSD